MKVMAIDGSRNLVEREVSDPVLRPGEILVSVRATALNRADLLQRAGLYPPPPGWPQWPGLEIAGVVADPGRSVVWKKGDRVCALLGGGGYAELAAVPEGLLMPVPEGLSLLQAAALPEAFATSYLDLVLTGRLQRGETVLIHAGASGLGLAAIQTARLFGAKTIIVTVGSEAKGEIARSFGADIVVNRKKESLAEVMATYPVDVAMDCVGTGISDCLELMAPGGRWILIAALGGETAALPLAAVYKRNLTVTGITLRSRPDSVKAFILSELVRHVWPELAAGRMRVRIHAVLPLAEAGAALAILERNENAGKVVLAVGAAGERGEERVCHV